MKNILLCTEWNQDEIEPLDNSVGIQTQTRDEAIKCFSILAKALAPFVESNQGSKIKILIKGSQEGGKSLVIDTIIRTLAADMSPYKMPGHSILERETCQSLRQYLIQQFKAANGQEFAAAFYRISMNEVYRDSVLEERAKTHKTLNSKTTLLEFETAFHKASYEDEDIVIQYVNRYKSKEKANTINCKTEYKHGTADDF